MINKQRFKKATMLVLWLGIIGAYWWITDWYDLTPATKVHLLADGFLNDFYGPLFFILVFSLQPLVFFPSFLLGIASGILYGPIWGVIYTFLGGNGAASICYLAGRFLGPRTIAQNDQVGLIQRQMSRLHSNAFETILICHLLVVIPFDIVNYAAGFLRMRWQPFALATAIGMIPGVMTFVLFGNSLGSLDMLMNGQPELNWRMMAISGVMILVGIGLSRLVKRFKQADLSTLNQP